MWTKVRRYRFRSRFNLCACILNDWHVRDVQSVTSPRSSRTDTNGKLYFLRAHNKTSATQWLELFPASLNSAPHDSVPSHTGSVFSLNHFRCLISKLGVCIDEIRNCSFSPGEKRPFLEHVIKTINSWLSKYPGKHQLLRVRRSDTFMYMHQDHRLI